MRAVDLFAGAGGWDIAARRLGVRTTGVEIDKDAAATLRQARQWVVNTDVRRLGPSDFEPMDGLIASPPCQTFSAAGKGAGRRNLDVVLRELEYLRQEGTIDYDRFDDERTGLVLEPMRWILDAHDREQPYEWVALEQVPPVLPVWEMYADLLLELGYSTDVGKLHAEQYGVPQTRTRAILVAHLGKDAKLPEPTHSRYYSRTPDKLDDGVQPWVSMAEALGWGMTARPYPVIASSRTTGGLDKEKVGGSEARATIYRERDAGRWRSLGDRYASRGTIRDVDEPAPTVTSSLDNGNYRWSDEPSPGPGRWLRSNTSDNATIRSEDEPAPTMHFGDRLNKMTWEQRRNSGPAAERTPRPVDGAPSYTIRANGSGSHPSGTEWVDSRPATTVQSTDRIGRPGHKCMTEDCHPGRGTDAQFDGSVRVSLEEAAALQTFPHAYPFQGTKTSKFRQIGNAIPPVLAHAILAELIKE